MQRLVDYWNELAGENLFAERISPSGLPSGGWSIPVFTFERNGDESIISCGSVLVVSRRKELDIACVQEASVVMKGESQADQAELSRELIARIKGLGLHHESWLGLSEV